MKGKHSFRGHKRRRDRIEVHKERANKERFSFENNKDDLIHFWLIESEDTPTSKFIVEFKLLKEITFKEFKKQLLEMVVGLYE